VCTGFIWLMIGTSGSVHVSDRFSNNNNYYYYYNNYYYYYLLQLGCYPMTVVFYMYAKYEIGYY
jgi:hypothetical protein